MSVLVEQQDETVDTIQTAAVNVEKDTETGYECGPFMFLHVPELPILPRLRHTGKAVAFARAARKKRWVCFIIIIIILAIIGIILGVHFGTKK